jgi:hypothetical protein
MPPSRTFPVVPSPQRLLGGRVRALDLNHPPVRIVIKTLNGDGLLVQGRILFAVQNQFNQVAVIKLNRRGTEGRFMQNLTSADFDVPTTMHTRAASICRTRGSGRPARSCRNRPTTG